jgi:hypothetical protein
MPVDSLKMFSVRTGIPKGSGRFLLVSMSIYFGFLQGATQDIGTVVISNQTQAIFMILSKVY